jgi:phage-related protein
LRGIRLIFTAIAVAIGIAVVAIAGVATVLGTMVSAFVGAVAMIWGLAASGFAAAIGFVDGIVGGIESGVGAVVDAVKGLASSALGAFKGVLGIASPSKVMLEHGEEDTAGAFAGGLDKGNAKVKASAKRMGEAAKPGKGGKGAGAGGGDGERWMFKDCTFIGTSEEMVRRIFAKVEEELAGEAGAQPAGAT